MTKINFANKRVAILGLGKSGFDAAMLLLRTIGAQVKVSDYQDNEGVCEKAKALNACGIETELGRHSVDFVQGSELIVVSPGVPNNCDVMMSVRRQGIPVIGEIELGSSLCRAPIVAITGSNGKTTVTTLTGEILKLTGKKVHVCGNIGTPFCNNVLNMAEDDLVCLEVSSFQLENIIHFKPKVAAFINFSRNHLDRHKDMQEYFDAKKRIFMNQDSDDWALLNFVSPEMRVFASGLQSKVIYFNHADRDETAFGSNPNFLAVAAIGALFGVSRQRCIEFFRTFKGIEHRMEQVRTVNGIDFINDSKSTTVDSAIWALEIIQKPVILIAGGRDKGADFSLLRESLQRKVRELILVGEAKDIIRKTVDNILPVRESSTLEEAVSVALRVAKSGDCVLLSPMCTSFDMFRDFEHRGEVFKEIVNKL